MGKSLSLTGLSGQGDASFCKQDSCKRGWVPYKLRFLRFFAKAQTVMELCQTQARRGFSSSTKAMRMLLSFTTQCLLKLQEPLGSLPLFKMIQTALCEKL